MLTIYTTPEWHIKTRMRARRADHLFTHYLIFAGLTISGFLTRQFIN